MLTRIFIYILMVISPITSFGVFPYMLSNGYLSLSDIDGVYGTLGFAIASFGALIGSYFYWWRFLRNKKR